MHLSCSMMMRRPRVYKMDRWFRHNALKAQAMHYRQKIRRSRIGMLYNTIRHGHIRQTEARYLRFRNATMLRNQRIEAACAEHGVKAINFKMNLSKCNIKLNNEILAILAMYEPRTFESLVEVSDRANIEILRGRTEILPDRRLTSETEV